MTSLEGRHVVVTGGGRGLGRAIAEAVSAAGAMVSLVARSRDQLELTATAIEACGGSARLHCADLSDLSALPALAETLASTGVDGVVHAAGIQHRADAREFDDDALHRVLTVNLEAPFALSRELVRRHRAGTTASHIFVGSLGSSIAIPRAIGYTAAKAGLLGIARTAANEWAADGIRVNVLSPGYFRTELTADLLEDTVQFARITARIPMGRLGRPDELGGAAVFLLSDAASYVTGQQLVVDGGWLSS